MTRPVRARMFGLALALAMTTTLGCSRADAPTNASPSATPSAMPAASGTAASVRDASGAAPASGAAAGAGASTAWAGSYDAVAGTLYVPSGKEWEGVKFRGEASELALGKGELAIAIDARGNVTGTLDGPLGPAIVSGWLQGETFTATLYPKDPSVAGGGFTGTLAGTASPANISGKLFASQAEARFIREASFVLKRK